MLIEDGVIHIDSFLAVTMGIIVLFVGRRLNQVVGFLKEFSIPDLFLAVLYSRYCSLCSTWPRLLKCRLI